MTSVSPAGTPRHFGAERALLGFYHPAAAQQPRGMAILLCPPLGQALARSQRMYRLLAQALSARNHAVLRFDYRCSGDSAGDGRELSWSRCGGDACTAAAELRKLSGLDTVLASGARLGANVALSATHEARFRGVLAWDPIVDGRAYVAAMDLLQTRLRSDGNRFLSPRNEADAHGEWVGFAVDERLRAELQAIRLDADPALKLLIDSMPAERYAAWREKTGSNVRLRTLNRPIGWHELDAQEDVILAHDVIDAVVAYLDGDFA